MDLARLEAIKVAMKFLFSFQKAIENSLSDGKFEVSDLMFFKDTLFGAPAVYKLLPFIQEGVKSLDKKSIEELHAYFVKEFDLKNDKVEEIIEEGLKVVISIFGLIAKAKG